MPNKSLDRSHRQRASHQTDPVLSWARVSGRWPGQLKRWVALINDVNTRTVKTLLAFPIASVVCFGASTLVAEILLALKHGFGAADMYAFLFWTSLFAVALLLPALAFALLLRSARTINRVWIGVLLGSLAGFGWTLLNFAMLGPWFGAWSFNVLYCWIVGGAMGILVVALFGQSQAFP